MVDVDRYASLDALDDALYNVLDGRLDDVLYDALYNAIYGSSIGAIVDVLDGPLYDALDSVLDGAFILCMICGALDVASYVASDDIFDDGLYMMHVMMQLMVDWVWQVLLQLVIGMVQQ